MRRTDFNIIIKTMKDRYYTTTYKDIPHGEKIIARDTLCVIAIAWESDVFQPEDEIHVIDWVYIYKE